MISFRKLSVERLLQGRRVFPLGTRKLIQLCVTVVLAWCMFIMLMKCNS